MGKFVAKKKFKLNFKMVGLILVGTISLIVTFNVLLASSIEKIVGTSLSASLMKNFLGNGTLNLNILNPKDLLSFGLNCVFKNEPLEEVKIIKNHTNPENPEIYIYNTHEGEAYSGSLIESYNIKYTVKIASYLLSDYLKDLEISSYVEPSSIEEFATTLNEPSGSMYESSRVFVSKRLIEFPNLKLLIDIHRDAVPKETSTAILGDKSYAKILFVVGVSHGESSSNRELAEKLNAKLDPAITRGIIEKSDEKGDGVYNQDLSKNACLIEIGGSENTIEEVDNTLKALSEAIFKYLREG